MLVRADLVALLRQLISSLLRQLRSQQAEARSRERPAGSRCIHACAVSLARVRCSLADGLSCYYYYCPYSVRRVPLLHPKPVLIDTTRPLTKQYDPALLKMN